MNEKLGGQTYTSTAKWFHWLILLLVGLELLIGVTMPGVRHNTSPGTLINFHFSFGLTIILTMVLRVLWRLTHPVPPLPKDTSWGQGAAAHITHFALYVLLFLIPFAGWMWANAVGWQVRAFWLIPMPTLVPKGWAYTGLAADSHVYLAVLICFFIAIHVLATIYHWYIKKDDVLERMLPQDKLTARVLKYLNKFR